MHGIPSKSRDFSVEENHKRFAEMAKGTEFGQTCCLRAKMSVDNPNKALRDPVIYRCNLTPHHHTGYFFLHLPLEINGKYTQLMTLPVLLWILWRELLML